MSRYCPPYHSNPCQKQSVLFTTGGVCSKFPFCKVDPFDMSSFIFQLLYYCSISVFSFYVLCQFLCFERFCAKMPPVWIAFDMLNFIFQMFYFVLCQFVCFERFCAKNAPGLDCLWYVKPYLSNVLFCSLSIPVFWKILCKKCPWFGLPLICLWYIKLYL